VSATGARQLGWLDERVITAITGDPSGAGGITLIDTVTGQTTPLPVTAYREVAVADGRVVVLAPTGAVAAYRVDAAPTSLADAGIASIDARAGRIAMLSREQLIVIDRDGTRHERTVAIPARVYSVRLSLTGARVAALTFDTIYEWATGSDAPPRTWPRSKRAETRLAYAGDQLYAWSSDGTGLAACDPDRTVTQWLTSPAGSIGLLPAEAGSSAVFATPEGRFAYAGALGLVELPHRPEGVSRIALDPTGRRLAIGTDEGEVELVDLAPAIPELHAVANDATLHAIARDRMVVGHEASGLLEIVELDGGARHRLNGGDRPDAWFGDDSVIAIGGFGDARALVIADRDGHVRYRADHVGSASISRDVTFATATGDVVQVTLPDAARARVLAHFEPKTIAMLNQTSLGVVVVVNGPGNAWPTYLVDDTGRHPLELGGDGMPTGFQYTADGTWWFVVRYEQLWRRPRDGVATAVPLEHRVNRVFQIQDRVIALGPTTTYELARDGRVQHTAPSVGFEVGFHDGFLLAAPTGVVAAMPVANVRRVLHVATTPTQLRATPDARTVGAVVTALDQRKFVAVWRDPVPVDPAEVPAYITNATDARIDPGSDELRWETATRSDR
jgi:hypothetical protein